MGEVLGKMIFRKKKYHVEIDLVNSICKIILNKSNTKVLEFYVDSAIDTLSHEDICKGILSWKDEEYENFTKIVLNINSSIWKQKKVIFKLYENYLSYYIKIKGSQQRINNINFLLNRNNGRNYTDFNKLYVTTLDSAENIVVSNINTNKSFSSEDLLNNIAYSYKLVGNKEGVSCFLDVSEANEDFLSFDYNGQNNKYFVLRYEGSTNVEGEFVSPELCIDFCEMDELEIAEPLLCGC